MTRYVIFWRGLSDDNCFNSKHRRECSSLEPRGCAGPRKRKVQSFHLALSKSNYPQSRLR